MSRRLPIALAVAVSASISAVSPAAPADERSDEKQACASAAEDAEQLRIDAKLRAARDRLLRCARPECPAAVRDDCAQWMNEVAAAMPTVVLAARDARGQDVLDAQVSVDGAIVARGLDGRPIEVDPGAHTFRFESGGAVTEQRALIREGEKAREITAVLDARRAPAAAPASGTPPAASHEAPAATSFSPRPSPWTWALAGIGVVAVGVGAYLELSVNSDAGSLQSACGHDCRHSQVDPLVLKQQVLGPIAFGVGALSLGLAAYTFFAAPTPGGAVAGVTGQFE